jgi:phosphoenolpyruvate synthase/pyruvate phosphate dikinase
MGDNGRQSWNHFLHTGLSEIDETKLAMVGAKGANLGELS